MEMALKKAGMTPADIDYVNAHGTSTMADTIELAPVKRLFGDKSPMCRCPRPRALSATFWAARVLWKRSSAFWPSATRSCPTLNLDNPDEGTEGVDLVPHVAKKRKVRAALNNSFGFGGTNASVIVKAFEE
jgi:3-oxoacyl-[acyl-carrier-protein] synthase II